ncbi:uncharacterized protein LOC110717663 isoform X2 [Chenopodium quinoa]|uniref:uncharacterized protein LOC110717663 isoform X2 n=1 Tax=Chenopodium quinoa TaxID=63459 RepID=UPI000B76F4BE|nr:uncharacterized protein LOC110717663 isoform X2 [Chenopodium quinoa]
MVDKLQTKQLKGAITEEDVCNLLQRYSAGTLLALLKEMAQVVDVKIDWQALMAKTETGIKSAREYQMLWRHLAYRQPLIENVCPEEPPLDDDSDLEYEVEACPPVSTTDATEASNCVKALTSGSANKSRMSNSSNIEVARVSIENPQVRKISPAAGIIGEGLNANGLTCNNQKKRKPCPEEEDIVLIASVKKGELKGESNTAQRTQRANTNRKKQGSLNIDGANTADSKLSDAQRATRYALNMALKDSPASGAATAKINASKRNLPVTKVTVPPSPPQPCAASSVKSTAMGSSTKLCPKRKPPQQSTVSADSIQATAKAAGARIGSPLDAASLFKAAQSKNVVRIRGGSPPLVKTPIVCTGLATTSTCSGTAFYALGAQQPKLSASGPSVLPVSQPPKVRATSVVTTERISTAQQMENKTCTAASIQQPDAKSVTRVQEDGASISQFLPKDKCQATSPGADVGSSKQTTAIGDSQCTINRDVVKVEGKNDTCKQVVESSAR